MLLSISLRVQVKSPQLSLLHIIDKVLVHAEWWPLPFDFEHDHPVVVACSEQV